MSATIAALAHLVPCVAPTKTLEEAAHDHPKPLPSGWGFFRILPQATAPLTHPVSLQPSPNRRESDFPREKKGGRARNIHPHLRSAAGVSSMPGRRPRP